MDTIHPQSPDREKTREITLQLFQRYDLKFEMNDLQILSISPNQAKVRVTQTTKRIRGPAFRDNQTVLIHTLRKDNNRWKIYVSEVQRVEFLPSNSQQ